MNPFRTLLSAGFDQKLASSKAFEKLVREETARQFARRAARTSPAIVSVPRRSAAPAVSF